MAVVVKSAEGYEALPELTVLVEVKAGVPVQAAVL